MTSGKTEWIDHKAKDKITDTSSTKFKTNVIITIKTNVSLSAGRMRAASTIRMTGFRIDKKVLPNKIDFNSAPSITKTIKGTISLLSPMRWLMTGLLPNSRDNVVVAVTVSLQREIVGTTSKLKTNTTTADIDLECRVAHLLDTKIVATSATGITMPNRKLLLKSW